jgi:hypothetical protein
LTTLRPDRLSFSLNLNGSYSQQNNAVDGNRFQSPIASAFTTTPLQGKINPATGKLYTGIENEYIGLTGDNFLYSLPLNTVDVNTFRLISKLSATYKILDNLSFTQNANIDLIGVDEVDYDDPTTADGVNDRGTLTTAYTQNRALTSQSLLRYFTNFGQDHDFDVMAVYEYQRTNFKTFNAGGKGFASGKLKTLDSAAEPNFVGGSQTDYSFISYLGQANYAFKGRYRLTGSFPPRRLFPLRRQQPLGQLLVGGWFLADQRGRLPGTKLVSSTTCASAPVMAPRVMPISATLCRRNCMASAPPTRMNPVAARHKSEIRI